MIAAHRLTVRVDGAILQAMTPTVLIADDDPVSLRFLSAALAQLGCQAIGVGNGADTLSAVQTRTFDLLLLDRCMPDLGGADLLAALRASGNATPAVATSAQVDVRIIAQLTRAGFLDVIAKPATLAELERVLGPLLSIRANPPAPASAAVPTSLLDDARALAAIGSDADTLSALRGLLSKELTALVVEANDVESLADTAAWRDRLHRLRSSCGFCGAIALAEAAARLEQNLGDDLVKPQSIFCDFLHICEATRLALCDQAPSAAADMRTSPSIPQARKPAPSR